MSAAHALEHSEHIAHSGGGHGAPDRLGMYIGVTMAILGVLLAYCSAMVGAERTHLLEKLVEQQHAHAKYQAQDVKHRVAVLALTQTHAVAFGSVPVTVNKEDMLRMALSVKRYLSESALAKDWTNSYDKVIKAHMEGQAEYEHGLLSAEIGIVVASIALMMKRKEAWFLSIVLGGVCIFFVVKTATHVGHEVKMAEQSISSTKAKYETARSANKTTKDEDAMVESVILWATAK